MSGDYANAWLRAGQEVRALEAENARLREERDALLPPYSAATQLFIDAICHYRNLSISLGAKPNDMINDYDRRLAESGVKDGDGEGWWNETPSLWDDLEAAEAERDRLREALERIRDNVGWGDYFACACIAEPDKGHMTCTCAGGLRRIAREALGGHQ